MSGITTPIILLKFFVSPRASSLGKYPLCSIEVSMRVAVDSETSDGLFKYLETVAVET